MKGPVSKVALSAAIVTLALPPTIALSAPPQSSPDDAERRCHQMNRAEPRETRAALIGRCVEEALAFDPSVYFGDPDARRSADEPGGIVDARYESSLHGPRWSFAINAVCQTGPRVGCPADQLQVLMRVVSWKAMARAPPGYRTPLHPTAQATQRFLDMAADWREADLRRCPGAVDALLALEDAGWFGFDPGDRSAIAGKREDELVVVADGAYVTVRAQGFASTYSASELSDTSGGTSAWAQQMMKVAEPCLKPAAGPPPWRRRRAG